MARRTRRRGASALPAFVLLVAGVLVAVSVLAPDAWAAARQWWDAQMAKAGAAVVETLGRPATETIAKAFGLPADKAERMTDSDLGKWVAKRTGAWAALLGLGFAWMKVTPRVVAPFLGRAAAVSVLGVSAPAWILAGSFLALAHYGELLDPFYEAVGWKEPGCSDVGPWTDRTTGALQLCMEYEPQGLNSGPGVPAPWGGGIFA